MPMDADVIVVGAGLAGLVAAAELADAGRRVIAVDQEPAASFGGQAYWSFGGLIFVDSPEQRRTRIRDSHELALADWLGRPPSTARRTTGRGPGPRRTWTSPRARSARGCTRWAMRWIPSCNGPNGAATPSGRTVHGNSVPRFHVTWGTGPGVIAPFARRVKEAADRGLVQLRFRHRVTGLSITDGAVYGRRGRGAGAERGRARRTELA